MRQAQPGGDVARVVDVLPGAAGALAVDRGAMVVKLHGEADDVIALARQHRRDDAGIDAPRHGHDDARLRRRLGQAERVQGWARERGGDGHRRFQRGGMHADLGSNSSARKGK